MKGFFRALFRSQNNEPGANPSTAAIREAVLTTLPVFAAPANDEDVINTLQKQGAPAQMLKN